MVPIPRGNKETPFDTSVCMLINGLSKEEVKHMQVLLER
uniref:Uncharacterized protein n=1 Tax=Peronospora matthiolae TaxID=2874970 RepID=A0AAV1U6G1_9STRA